MGLFPSVAIDKYRLQKYHKSQYVLDTYSIKENGNTEIAFTFRLLPSVLCFVLFHSDNQLINPICLSYQSKIYEPLFGFDTIKI